MFQVQSSLTQVTDENKFCDVHCVYMSGFYFRILPQRGQTLSSKIQGGQPHIKRTEKPIPRGANGSQWGAKAPPSPPPPQINPACTCTYV